MRRTTMVIGIYMVVIGAILGLIGYFTHAPRTVVWDNGFHVAQPVEYTKNVSKFSNIVINGSDGKVIVQKGDKFKIHVEGDRRQAPRYDISDGTLFINKQPHAKLGFTGPEQIVVTVPKNADLDTIEANLGNDDINLNGIKIQKLRVNNSAYDNSGRLNLNSTKVENSAKMNLNYYRLKVTNSTLNNLSLSAGNTSDSDDTTLESFDYDETIINQIVFQNSTLNNSKFDTNQSDISIKNSKLNTTTSNNVSGQVTINKSEMTGLNSFTMYKGVYKGVDNRVDGYDVSNTKGRITFLNRRSNNIHKYQVNTDAENLLRIKGGTIRITIR